MSLSISRRAYNIIIQAIKSGKTVMYMGNQVTIDYEDDYENLAYYSEEYDTLISIYYTNYVQITLDNGLYQITNKEYIQ